MLAPDKRADWILREVFRRLSFEQPDAGPSVKLRELGYVNPADIAELKRQIVGVVRDIVGPEVTDFADELELFPDDTVLRIRQSVTRAFGRLPGTIIVPPDDEFPARTGSEAAESRLGGNPLYPDDDDEAGG